MTIFLATAAIAISLILCFLIAYQEREIEALQKSNIAAQELIKDLEKTDRDAAMKLSSFKLETFRALRAETEERLHDCNYLSKRIAHFEKLEARTRMQMKREAEAKHDQV